MNYKLENLSIEQAGNVKLNVANSQILALIQERQELAVVVEDLKFKITKLENKLKHGSVEIEFDNYG